MFSTSLNQHYDIIICVYWFKLFSQVSDVAHGSLVLKEVILMTEDEICLLYKYEFNSGCVTIAWFLFQKLFAWTEHKFERSRCNNRDGFFLVSYWYNNCNIKEIINKPIKKVNRFRNMNSRGSAIYSFPIRNVHNSMFINDFFVYQLIYVPLENISLIGNRIHCRWRIANLDLCLVPLVTHHGGIFIAPHLLRQWASTSFVIHPLDRPSLVAFQDKQKVQRTYSNLDLPWDAKLTVYM